MTTVGLFTQRKSSRIAQNACATLKMAPCLSLTTFKLFLHYSSTSPPLFPTLRFCLAASLHMPIFTAPAKQRNLNWKKTQTHRFQYMWKTNNTNSATKRAHETTLKCWSLFISMNRLQWKKFAHAKNWKRDCKSLFFVVVVAFLVWARELRFITKFSNVFERVR